ncbi:hypothetical protein C7T94_05905 [Pedobacter yulinensis]|uniref:Uncharacterized protein n=1 Tax=Pedobacter yulinensis TaxID=2126353 RepID=A0A2T3HPC4_9SPHI|nr:hypothetical protein [Pedobacter yulinensis]PST84253.1 hypothetical protein C7T94_05905 [Pedobacter yulinensis]
MSFPLSPERKHLNVLVLCDFPNLIRYKRSDRLMVRHLYNLLFIFSQNGATVTLNDRSGLPHDVLWVAGSELTAYANPFLSRKAWAELEFEQYDVVVCHFDLERELASFLATGKPAAGDSVIWSMLNPWDSDYQYRFTRVDQLFEPGAAFCMDETFLEQQLKPFRKRMQAACRTYTYTAYLKTFGKLVTALQANNLRLAKKPCKRILIADDYRRRLYLGDSVVWMNYVKKLLRHCGDFDQVTINIDNDNAFDRLQSWYGPAFGAKVVISKQPFASLDFATYDLVVLETDLVLKFLLQVQDRPTSFSATSVYTINPLTDQPDGRQDGWDFLAGKEPAAAFAKKPEPVCRPERALAVSTTERAAADSWLETQGVNSDHGLIVLLSGSSRAKKVLPKEEFYDLVGQFLQHTPARLLIFLAEDLCETDFAAAGLLSDRLIFRPAGGVREDLGFLISRYTRLVIGPCTGMLHFANAAWIYLLLENKVNAKDLPQMVVYTGKQEHDKDYLPHNWWGDSLVRCLVLIIENGLDNLVDMRQLPAEVEFLQTCSDQACNITAKLLFNKLTNIPEMKGLLRAAPPCGKAEPLCS